jgi:hypothetical protein
MHSAQSRTRKPFVSGLVVLAMFFVAFFALAPSASAARSDCPYDYVCVWAQANYQGTLSYWPGWDWGCKTHVYNPSIRSTWNRSGWWVRYGGQGTVGPDSWIADFGPVTGRICWPV